VSNEPIEFEDGKAYVIDPSDTFIQLICCDCGLVHDISLEILEDGRLAFKLERNDEKTVEIRDMYEFGSSSFSD
jgi:hypothetical protein